MKKLFFYFFWCIFFVACNEEHNFVSLSNSESVDTTYILPKTSIPLPEPHNVLVELFTGVSCSNCPAGHAILEAAEKTNIGRVITIALYDTAFTLNHPNPGERYKGFRNGVAQAIENRIYSTIISEPLAGIDRMPREAGNLSIQFPSKSEWTNAITNNLSIKDSLNLSVSSNYNPSTGYAKIVAKIIYLQQTSTLQNLSLAIVEDSLIDIQMFPNSIFALDTFAGVFRDLVTSIPLGDPIYDSIHIKEIGRVCQKVYNYKVKPAFIAKNCRVIAFVHGNGAVGGQPIYQAVQTKLFEQ